MLYKILKFVKPEKSKSHNHLAAPSGEQVQTGMDVGNTQL
jgi:hypothetical protein